MNIIDITKNMIITYAVSLPFVLSYFTTEVVQENRIGKVNISTIFMLGIFSALTGCVLTLYMIRT